MEEISLSGTLALSSSAGDISGSLTTVEACLGAAFLVRYSGHTRETYLRALRHWSQWCMDHDLALLEVRREHVERWLRELEETGTAASTRAVHLAAVSGYYELAVDEELMRRNPVGAVRRPKLPKDSQRLGIDKDDGTRLLAVAEVKASRRDYLLACSCSTASESPRPWRSTSTTSASSAGTRSPRCGARAIHVRMLSSRHARLRLLTSRVATGRVAPCSSRPAGGASIAGRRRRSRDV